MAGATKIAFSSALVDLVADRRFELCGLVVDATPATFVNEAALGKRACVNVTGALVATRALTFVENETTVSHGSTTSFVNGTEANLADGVNVKVKGSLSSDRTTVVASRLTFKQAGRRGGQAGRVLPAHACIPGASQAAARRAGAFPARIGGHGVPCGLDAGQRNLAAIALGNQCAVASSVWCGERHVPSWGG
jgi:hypothetical protein